MINKLAATPRSNVNFGRLGCAVFTVPKGAVATPLVAAQPAPVAATSPAPGESDDIIAGVTQDGLKNLVSGARSEHAQATWAARTMARFINGIRFVAPRKYHQFGEPATAFVDSQRLRILLPQIETEILRRLEIIGREESVPNPGSAEEKTARQAVERLRRWLHLVLLAWNVIDPGSHAEFVRHEQLGLEVEEKIFTNPWAQTALIRDLCVGLYNVEPRGLYGRGLYVLAALVGVLGTGHTVMLAAILFFGKWGADAGRQAWRHRLTKQWVAEFLRRLESLRTPLLKPWPTLTVEKLRSLKDANIETRMQEMASLRKICADAYSGARQYLAIEEVPVHETAAERDKRLTTGVTAAEAESYDGYHGTVGRATVENIFGNNPDWRNCFTNPDDPHLRFIPELLQKPYGQAIDHLKTLVADERCRGELSKVLKQSREFDTFAGWFKQVAGVCVEFTQNFVDPTAGNRMAVVFGELSRKDGLGRVRVRDDAYQFRLEFRQRLIAAWTELMENCIRAESWEDALLVWEHLRKLDSAYVPSNGVMHALKAAIDAAVSLPKETAVGQLQAVYVATEASAAEKFGAMLAKVPQMETMARLRTLCYAMADTIPEPYNRLHRNYWHGRKHRQLTKVYRYWIQQAGRLNQYTDDVLELWGRMEGAPIKLPDYQRAVRNILQKHAEKLGRDQNIARIVIMDIENTDQLYKAEKTLWNRDFMRVPNYFRLWGQLFFKHPNFYDWGPHFEIRRLGETWKNIFLWWQFHPGQTGRDADDFGELFRQYGIANAVFSIAGSVLGSALALPIRYGLFFLGTALQMGGEYLLGDVVVRLLIIPATILRYQKWWSGSLDDQLCDFHFRADDFDEGAVEIITDRFFFKDLSVAQTQQRRMFERAVFDPDLINSAAVRQKAATLTGSACADFGYYRARIAGLHADIPAPDAGREEWHGVQLREFNEAILKLLWGFKMDDREAQTPFTREQAQALREIVYPKFNRWSLAIELATLARQPNLYRHQGLWQEIDAAHTNGSSTKESQRAARLIKGLQQLEKKHAGREAATIDPEEIRMVQSLNYRLLECVAPGLFHRKARSVLWHALRVGWDLYWFKVRQLPERLSFSHPNSLFWSSRYAVGPHETPHNMREQRAVDDVLMARTRAVRYGLLIPHRPKKAGGTNQ